MSSFQFQQRNLAQRRNLKIFSIKKHVKLSGNRNNMILTHPHFFIYLILKKNMIISFKYFLDFGRHFYDTMSSTTAALRIFRCFLHMQNTKARINRSSQVLVQYFCLKICLKAFIKIIQPSIL